jgi:hypothetical protein
MEGMTVALSHPSEGWHEKGHTSDQIPGRAKRRGPSQAMFKSRLVYGSGVVFQKKATSPWGWSNEPGISLNQPLGIFEARH